MTAFKIITISLEGNDEVVRSSYIKLLNRFIRVSLWIIFINMGMGLSGVFAGFILSYVISTTTGFLLINIKPGRPSRGHFYSILEYSRYSWIGSVKNTSWVWIDTLILGIFVAKSQVGIYEVAWQVSGILFFAASAVGQVIFPDISKLSVEGYHEDIRNLVRQAITYAGIVAIPGFVGLIWVGKDVLRLFGEEYTVGYLVLIVLTLARLLHSYEEIGTRIINAVNSPRYTFSSSILFLLSNIILNIILVNLIGYVGAAIATMISMALSLVVLVYALHKTNLFSIPGKELVVEVVSAGFMGVWLAVIRGITSYTYPYSLIVSIITGCVVYFTLILFIGKVTKIGIVENFPSNN